MVPSPVSTDGHRLERPVLVTKGAGATGLRLGHLPNRETRQMPNGAALRCSSESRNGHRRDRAGDRGGAAPRAGRGPGAPAGARARASEGRAVIVPDAISPVEGYRVWAVGLVRLWSPSAPSPGAWPVALPLRARCLARRANPLLGTLDAVPRHAAPTLAAGAGSTRCGSRGRSTPSARPPPSNWCWGESRAGAGSYGRTRVARRLGQAGRAVCKPHLERGRGIIHWPLARGWGIPLVVTDYSSPAGGHGLFVACAGCGGRGSPMKRPSTDRV